VPGRGETACPRNLPGLPIFPHRKSRCQPTLFSKSHSQTIVRKSRCQLIFLSNSHSQAIVKSVTPQCAIEIETTPKFFSKFVPIGAVSSRDQIAGLGVPPKLSAKSARKLRRGPHVRWRRSEGARQGDHHHECPLPLNAPLSPKPPGEIFGSAIVPSTLLRCARTIFVLLITQIIFELNGEVKPRKSRFSLTSVLSYLPGQPWRLRPARDVCTV
jgi:hypothetical protein